MLLAIDIGNTRIKAAVFENNTLINLDIVNPNNFSENILNILNQHPKISNIIVSSVSNIHKDDFLAFEDRVKIEFIAKNTRMPFKNLYQTPETLGMDRMVLSAGATLRFKNTNRLVIDTGTCITYDFIDTKNNYLGGAISPGIKMRYEALNRQTAKLPLLENSFPKDFIGNSTQESIHSGVVIGVIMEIEGFIKLYQSRYPNLEIILTGGDTDFLAMQLKNTIFANSNFLLESMNQIFQYNQND